MRLEGKVLITGGAGFLGRAIMARALADNWDCEFIVYSRDEQKQDLIKRRFPNARNVLGDIRDTERLGLACMGVDTIIHAAALKYIPEAEFNVNECVSINVMGSQSVIRAARFAEVPRVLAISTDKAVMPLNVYGATKMVMERLFVEADNDGVSPQFGAVRYGNVIGSTGSIIPVLQQQASENKLVTLTDPAMTRFWMTATQAVDLILHGLESLNFPRNFSRGEIVVSLAPAMTLLDLFGALELEVPHTIIGRRPGEKMDESLLSEYEATKVTYVDRQYVHFMPLGKPTTNESHTAQGYHSDSPDRWLSPSELREAVIESVQI